MRAQAKSYADANQTIAELKTELAAIQLSITAGKKQFSMDKDELQDKITSTDHQLKIKMKNLEEVGSQVGDLEHQVEILTAQVRETRDLSSKKDVHHATVADNHEEASAETARVTKKLQKVEKERDNLAEEVTQLQSDFAHEKLLLERAKTDMQESSEKLVASVSQRGTEARRDTVSLQKAQEEALKLQARLTETQGLLQELQQRTASTANSSSADAKQTGAQTKKLTAQNASLQKDVVALRAESAELKGTAESGEKKATKLSRQLEAAQKEIEAASEMLQSAREELAKEKEDNELHLQQMNEAKEAAGGAGDENAEMKAELVRTQKKLSTWQTTAKGIETALNGKIGEAKKNYQLLETEHAATVADLNSMRGQMEEASSKVRSLQKSVFTKLEGLIFAQLFSRTVHQPQSLMFACLGRTGLTE